MSKAFIFKANKGKLDIGSDFNRARLGDELTANDGKQYRLEKVQELRTNNQNNYYFNYLVEIEFETGNNATYLHEYFKRTLLPPKFIKVMGKEIKIPSSTKSLTKLEMGEYMEKISAETNVPLPNPQEAGYLPR